MNAPESRGLAHQCPDVLMNDWFLPICLAVVLTVTLTGCQVIADIFQAGFWVGIIAAVVVIGLIFFLIRLVSSASR